MYKTREFTSAYAEEKDQHPFRIHMERYTLLKLLGDMKGSSILDVACGAGNYSRLFCELGARKVVGVDYSKAMIDIAKEQTSESLPITYFQESGQDFAADHTFDVVFHAYYLNYADSQSQLEAMSRGLLDNLSEGGRMVGAVCVLGQNPRPDSSFLEFHTEHESLDEGQKYPIYFKNQTECIYNYNWSKPTLSAAMEQAGFQNIEWSHPLTDYAPVYSRQRWDDLVGKPIYLAVTATK